MDQQRQADLLLVLLLGMVVGGSVVCGLMNIADHQDAIAHHAAHYDSQTGAFTWNQPAQPQPRSGETERP